MKKYLLVAVLLIGLVVILGKVYSPGSYANAVTYDIKLDEQEVIRLISKLKNENRQFQVPIRFGLEDHRNEYWYVTYFYFQEEDLVLYTWTRPSGKGTTTMALVSIKEHNPSSNWKKFNGDLDKKVDRELRTKFENRVLKRIVPQ